MLADQREGLKLLQLCTPVTAVQRTRLAVENDDVIKICSVRKTIHHENTPILF